MREPAAWPEHNPPGLTVPILLTVRIMLTLQILPTRQWFSEQ